MPNRADGDIYVVILIGGVGKRLRPLSTDSRPKAFLSVTRDRKTMFGSTLARAKKLVGSKNIVIVANRRHLKLIKKDFPDIGKGNLLLEPIARNTAPAIAFAASVLYRRSHNSVMVVLPTDQYISDEARYLDAVRRGILFLAVDSKGIVVVGIKPNSPATGFGYVRLSSSKPYMKANGVFRADRFVEKPDVSTAKRYLASGKYLWNSGLFIFRTETILKEFKASAPIIYNNLIGKKKIESAYLQIPDMSIDYAVMEKAKSVFCVKGCFRWQDMGSFDSLKKILRRESRDFIVEDGKIVKIL